MKILYLEDNQRLANLTISSLSKLGYVLDYVDNIDEAVSLMDCNKYDLYLIDRMLPGSIDGIELCQARKRQNDTTPSLVLTALIGTNNRIEGFSAGVDDYMEKPFDITELDLRLKKLARVNNSQTSHLLRLNQHLDLDLARQIVYLNNHQVYLTRKQWMLLEYLALHQNQTISKQTLIDRVWGVDSDVLENAIEATLLKLRRKINDSENSVIQTIYGVGYRLIVV
jgi:two-component system, OmpR family, response regulator